MNVRFFTTIICVFISIVSNCQWTQLGNVINGTSNGDRFGMSVSLSSNGKIIAIGAPQQDVSVQNDGQDDFGYVRVFEEISGEWIQLGQDIGGVNIEDHFGHDISISGDGTTLAVGSWLSGSEEFSGQVKVFKYLSGGWQQIGSTINGDEENALLSSVELNFDGSKMIVGSPGANKNSVNSCGIARVYENISNNWIQIGQDLFGDLADQQLGREVSISSDGNTVAISSRYYDQNDDNLDEGIIEVYELVGSNWVQKGQSLSGINQEIWMGNCLKIASNGQSLATSVTLDPLSGPIVARVFEFQNNLWSQKGTDIHTPADLNGNYNSVINSISISSDGNFLLVGDIEDAPDYQGGQARLYEFSLGSWTQKTEVNGENNLDQFGWSVSMSSDASIFAVGSRNSSNNNGSFAGHVKIFGEALSNSSNSNYLNKNIKVFPNPNKGIFQLKFDQQDASGLINIINPLGKSIHKQFFSSNTIDIDLIDHPSGIYFIEITSQGNNYIERLLIEN